LKIGSYKNYGKISFLDVLKKYYLFIIVSFSLLCLLSILFIKTSKINSKLKSALRIRDVFFSIISHDLKSPFSTIKYIADQFYYKRGDLDDEDMDNFSKALYKSTQSVYDLISNLLSWGNLQLKGKTSSHKEVVVVEEIVKKVFDLYAPVAELKNVQLVSSANSSNDKLTVNKDMFELVLRNLVNNAIKFSPSKGKVYIDTDNNEDRYFIRIRDEGYGMDSNKLSNLFNFDKKYISDDGDHLDGIGTGLGLMFCNEFMTASGGSLTVESEVDKGSVFTLMFKNSFVIEHPDDVNDELSCTVKSQMMPK